MPALQAGEELDYRVRYWFITIATVQFKVTDKFERDGRTVYRAASTVDANPSLHWLTQLHLRCASEIDQEGFSYSWLCNDSSSTGVTYTSIQFDYPNQRMYYRKGQVVAGERVPSSVDTVPVSGHNEDGVSLVFYLREHARQQTDEHIPAFLSKQQVFLDVNYANDLNDIGFGAVDYPVDAIRIKGRADFIGAGGLTGAFEAWVSNDDARVVITARLKVIVGSVTAELVKWKRADWAPPHCGQELPPPNVTRLSSPECERAASP
jgi:hypothetical protein